jgi:hypothetical protein
MGKGGGNAPSPDPRIGEAATKQAETGEKWLQYATDQAAIATKRQGPIDKLAADVQGTQLGIMKEQAQLGREDRARYESEFRPMEDRLVREAGQAGTQAKQDEAAAAAAGDVQQAATGSREAAIRQAEAIGIAPGSGQYAGITRAGDAATALATAGAKNTARAGERGRALALTADVANMGRGLPAQAAAGAGNAVNAGGAAFTTAAGNQQLSMAPTQVMGQGFGGAMSGYQGQANTLSNLYGLNLQKYQIDQQSKDAGMSAIGQGVGALACLAVLSDPKAKKNVKATKKGSGLKAIKKMPVKTFDYKPGQGDGGVGHIGTMSDKFAQATGQPDRGVIKLQDALGITMKAVQDLDAKVSKLDKSKTGKAKKSKTPAPRRATQSPAKARTTIRPAKPAVRPQKTATLGIRRG